MTKELILYADESTVRGRFYSNFYGGLIVRSNDLTTVQSALALKKEYLHFYGEVKWQKVTRNYLDKYVTLMDTFFDFVAQDKIKVRIMFTQNVNVPRNLTQYQQDNEYHLLYYQFIKHGFGLTERTTTTHPVALRIYLDRMPNTKANNLRFKRYLSSLEGLEAFQHANIRLPLDQIAEVDSHNHNLLQCLDIVLGAMQFRLNDKHKVKPAGSRTRGSRTRAKEQLYKHILVRIRGIYPNFNIGINTGIEGDRRNYWRHPYRHWLFVPSDFERDKGLGKRG